MRFFWWGRKSSKTTKESNYPEGDCLDLSKRSVKNESTNSPRKSSDSSGSCSNGSSSSSNASLEAVMGFGSYRSQPIPLPRLSGMNHPAGFGSGSGSVSSVSSSGSSDDHTSPDHGHFGNYRLVGALFCSLLDLIFFSPSATNNSELTAKTNYILLKDQGQCAWCFSSQIWNGNGSVLHKSLIFLAKIFLSLIKSTSDFNKYWF